MDQSMILLEKKDKGQKHKSELKTMLTEMIHTLKMDYHLRCLHYYNIVQITIFPQLLYL